MEPEMTCERLPRLAALIAAATAPAAAGASIKADHCGSITSANGQYRASFTLVRNVDPRARTIRVFLCDLSYNCDTVFEAPSDAEVSMQWRPDGDLAVTAGEGALVPPGKTDSIARGRPPVRIVVRPAEFGSPSGTRLDFASNRCRVEAPIISQRSVGSF